MEVSGNEKHAREHLWTPVCKVGKTTDGTRGHDGADNCSRDIEDNRHDRVQIEGEENHCGHVGCETVKSIEGGGECGQLSHIGQAALDEDNSRYDEVNETIPEDELDETATGAHANARAHDELPASEAENDKVETHGIDERAPENRSVRFRNHTSCARNKDSLQENAVKEESPVPENADDERDRDIKCLRPNCNSVKRKGVTR